MVAITDRAREILFIRHSVEIIENVLAGFGYERFDAPILQPSELFLTRAGDLIADHLLTLDYRNQRLALRPEFTSPAVAAYIRNGADQPVIRWSFSGPVFEDRPPEDSLQTESVGAELLGMPGRFAEAEIIALAGLAAEQLGIAGYEIAIGHVGLTRHLLAQFGLDARAQRLLLNFLNHQTGPVTAELLLNWLEKFVALPTAQKTGEEAEDHQSRVLQALMKTTDADAMAISGRTRDEILERLLRKQQRLVTYERLSEAVNFLANYASLTAPLGEDWLETAALLPAPDERAKALVDEMHQVVSMVTAYGIDHQKLVIKPALARSWDYYSGIVFELRVNGTLFAGGGRYDDFAELLGSPHEVPAVGLAFYLNNTILAKELIEAASPQTLKIQLTPTSDGSAAVLWAQKLRALGLKIAVTETASPDSYLLQGDQLVVNSRAYRLGEIQTLVDALKEKSVS